MNFHLTPSGHATKAFGDLMGKLAEAFPSSRSLTAEQVLLYARALGDIPFDMVRHGCTAAIRECKFFPSIAELRDCTMPSIGDAAVLAWVGLQRAAESDGAYASLVCEDGCVTAALLDVFGSWPEFCETKDGAGLAIARQAFLAAYRRARHHGGLSVPRRLAGLCEASGQYPSGEQAQVVWVSRLSLTGTVTHERDDPAKLLQSHIAPKELGE